MNQPSQSSCNLLIVWAKNLVQFTEEKLHFKSHSYEIKEIIVKEMMYTYVERGLVAFFHSLVALIKS